MQHGRWRLIPSDLRSGVRRSVALVLSLALLALGSPTEVTFAEEMNSEPTKDAQTPVVPPPETAPSEERSEATPAEGVPTEAVPATPAKKAAEASDEADAPASAKADEAEAEPVAAPKPMARPYLWVADASPPIYFLGTIHVPDPRVLVQPEIVLRALDRSDVVLTEINSEQADFNAIRALMQQPPGYLLSHILPKDLFARTKAALEAAGQDIKKLEHTKVWAASFMLPFKPASDTTPAAYESMDAAIIAKARALSKEIGALESAIEQLRVFDDMPLNDQIYLLRNAVDGVERAARGEPSALDDLLNVYLEGDETKLYCALCAELDPYRTGNCAFMCRLLDDRNVRMLDRLFRRRQAAPNKIFFVAVGAGHYPGTKGMLALMRQRGYTLRRIENMDGLAPAGATDGSQVPVVVHPAPPPASMGFGTVPAPLRYRVPRIRHRRGFHLHPPCWHPHRCK